MFFATFLPVLCFTASVASVTVPARDNGAGVAEQQHRVKRDDSGAIKLDNTKWTDTYSEPFDTLGPGPIQIDPEVIPPSSSSTGYGDSNAIKNGGDKYPAHMKRRYRRSATSISETVPDRLGVSPEQAIQWAGELRKLLSKRTSAVSRQTSDLQSRSPEPAPVPENLKREDNENMKTVWNEIGAPNDIRLIDIGGHQPANQKLKRDGAVSGNSQTLIIERRVKATAEILAALNGQEELKRANMEDDSNFDRRATAILASSPVDVKPVQEEVIYRIFKFGENKNQKRDSASQGLSLRRRQDSPEDVSRRILQELFRFEDGEMFKRDFPVEELTERERWIDWSSLDVTDKIREPDSPPSNEGKLKKRPHRARGISADVFDSPVRTDAKDPYSYGWPDISLKVREVLPKEADVISQRIIVTIFRMQEDFRHKRSIDVEQEPKSDKIEKRTDSKMDIWLGNLARRAGFMRLWIGPPRRRHHKAKHPKKSKHPKKAKHPKKTKYSKKAKHSKVQRRTLYSTLTPTLPTGNDVHDIKWGSQCSENKECFLPWNMRKLQSSTDVLRRIVDSIGPDCEDELQITKLAIASDLLSWLENLNENIEVGGIEYPAGDDQTVGYITEGAEGKEQDGYKSIWKVSRWSISQTFDLSRLALQSDGTRGLWNIGNHVAKLKARYEIIVCDILKIFSPVFAFKTKRETSAAHSGILNSITTFFKRSASQVDGGLEARAGEAPASRLKKRYDPYSYPYWSGGSEGGPTRVSSWGEGPSCLRLRTSNGCGGDQPDIYKRTHAKLSPENGFEKRNKDKNQRKEKKERKKYDAGKEEKGKRGKRRGKGKNTPQDYLTSELKNPNDIRLGPSRNRRNLG